MNDYLNIYFYFRQMVPRIALETLRQVVGDPSDVELVFTILERLAEDLGKCPVLLACKEEYVILGKTIWPYLFQVENCFSL